ncbi:MAG: thymidylate kinase [Deltaproteobacteria bacterium SG8_13]|nr:MAG: thymidylate kinase [Deltaproteobacteria bacterium SG8_13]
MFITLEGIEGSGKTTQLKPIEAFFTRRGLKTVVTREPGGTAVGEKIRAVLLNPDIEKMAPLTELFLYEADRIEHLEKTIRPALAAGKIVVCDRFCDATVVYQGYGRGLDLEMIGRLHRMILGGLTPDLTIVFDLPPEIGLERAWKQVRGGSRSGKEMRFEKEKLAFHRSIRDGYLTIARLEPERFAVVDAGADANAVSDAVIALLEQFIDRDR